MNADVSDGGWKDKPLFTPGPLTTSATVKQAMLRDFGSRDYAFIQTIREVRDELLGLAGVSAGDYEAILMQGSGTFALEAVLSSTVPPDGKVLVIVNGAYGKRLAQMASVLKIPCEAVTFPENSLPDLDHVRSALEADKAVTHVSIAWCETTTGIINPVREIGQIARETGRTYFVDAMSSFGAYPTSLAEDGIDFLVSSSNKCIEGVPGFGFVLARKEALLASDGCARSVSLDLLSQWKGFEKDGQFRFTPPTHAIVAFRQALRELEAEGGVEARGARYEANHETIVRGMRELGFKEYLPPELQGCIITSFLYPDDANFSFETFYEKLNDKGYVIYPGKVSDADCFRIGHIGRLTTNDMHDLLRAIVQTIDEMGVKLR